MQCFFCVNYLGLPAVGDIQEGPFVYHIISGTNAQIFPLLINLLGDGKVYLSDFLFLQIRRNGQGADNRLVGLHIVLIQFYSLVLGQLLQLDLLIWVVLIGNDGKICLGLLPFFVFMSIPRKKKEWLPTPL